MKNIEQNAHEIRAAIREAEALGDELMSSLASLKLKMLAARSHPEIVPHEGQKAILLLQRAEQKTVAAANDLFRVHDELSDIATKMDFEHPTPQTGSLELEDTPIAEVAAT